MACSRQAGPAAYLKFIEDETGEHVTQQDWHDVRKLAQADGYKVSRRRVASADAESTADDLYRSFASDHSVDGEAFAAMNDGLARANNTEATVSIVSYLAANGVKDTLARVRADRKAAKAADTDPYAGDNAAEAELADADREYADRVRALEDELGVSTSDAQGMVDAEDLIRERAKQGPYGEARLGSKYRGYRDAADISRDIRGDIKKAVKDGDLPADVKASVRTDKYAGGQAVNVELTGWAPERVWHQEADRFGMVNWTYTPEAVAVMDRVEAMRGAYNRDASDSQQDYFDVTYYGRTSWGVPAP